MAVDFHDLTVLLERVHSPRLALRQIALADSWPLFEATRNPNFNKHLLWDSPSDEGLLLDRIDAIVDSSRRGRISALSAVVKATGEWVSLFRFQPYAANPDLIEMGIWTHAKFWHGRYSLELGQVCVDAAFAFSEVAALIGAASPDNKSSCRLMQLCGLSATQLVYRHTESGAEVALQEFKITRQAWSASRRRRVYSQVELRTAPLSVKPRVDSRVAEAEAL